MRLGQPAVAPVVWYFSNVVVSRRAAALFACSLFLLLVAPGCGSTSFTTAPDGGGGGEDGGPDALLDGGTDAVGDSSEDKELKDSGTDVAPQDTGLDVTMSDSPSFVDGASEGSFTCTGTPTSCGSGGSCMDCTLNPMGGQACIGGVMCGCMTEQDCPAGYSCQNQGCKTTCDGTHPCNGGCCDLSMGGGQCAPGNADTACREGNATLCTNCTTVGCPPGNACVPVVTGGSGFQCGCDAVRTTACSGCMTGSICNLTTNTCQ